MQKYFVSEVYKEEAFTAGVVNQHIEQWLLSFGYKPLRYFFKRNNVPFIKILRLIQVLYWAYSIPRNSMVLFHVPVIPRASLFFLKVLKRRNYFTVALVHDLDGLRFADLSVLIKEKEVIGHFQHIILHNERMQNFVGSFYPIKQISLLVLFDYYSSSPHFIERKLCKTIALAANLQKANYLNDEFLLWLKKNSTLTVNIYGKKQAVDDESSLPRNLKLYGAVHPDLLPSSIEGSFGIVWDGNTITTCNSNLGEYLYYNTPHKLCLYLCAGLPVIVWEKSAMAKWVLENNVGITSSSWQDAIEKIEYTSNDTYALWHKNAIEIGKKLRTGFYLKKVLRELEELNRS